MSEGLSKYGRRLLVNKAKLLAELTTPLLVWEAPGEAPNEKLFMSTAAGAGMVRPHTGEPLVFELKKSLTPNAFALGVTIGRTENNDLVIYDNSVSRFHAYFQQDPRTHEWKVADAESKNGTWLGTVKLLPKVGYAVPDGAQLRVGDITLVYFTPASFIVYLQKKMAGS